MPLDKQQKHHLDFAQAFNNLTANVSFEQLTPPFPILAAFAASIAMPLLLIGYAHGPFGRLSLGRRFWLAMGTAAGFWLLLIVWLAAVTEKSISSEFGFDVVAGAAIMLTAGLVVYSIWGIASFGFTLLMLACLAEKAETLNLDAWAAAYGQGHGMHAFTKDRITVLIGTGFAEEREGQLRLRGYFALRFAGLVYFVARVFAVAIEK